MVTMKLMLEIYVYRDTQSATKVIQIRLGILLPEKSRKLLLYSFWGAQPHIKQKPHSASQLLPCSTPQPE